MARIEELEQRITAALDRIGQGLEGMTAGAADADEVETLRRALDAEERARARLQNRLDALEQQQSKTAAAEEAAHRQQADALRRLDMELQSLRKANQGLRDSNKALREANEAGVGDAHLINKSMLSELEALRAVRAADEAENGAILADLDRLIARASTPETTQAEEA